MCISIYTEIRYYCANAQKSQSPSVYYIEVTVYYNYFLIKYFNFGEI
jgi:hypothetical protein